MLLCIFGTNYVTFILAQPFLAFGYAAPIINIIVGGPLWCVIVVVGLFMIWDLLFDIDLVEYNRISQFSKAVIYACIMLFLIDIVLVPGWIEEVVSIVAFGSLFVAGILFFSDIERQKQNMMPLLFLILLNVIGTVLGLTLYKGEFYWTYIVMGSISFALIVICAIVLGKNLLKEIAKRFHVK